MLKNKPLIVGIGGTPRLGSSSERALAVSLKAAEAAGARTLLFAGTELALPIYAPGQELPDRAERLLAALRECRGLIISSPAYHGSISGLIKNALDYAEELRTDSRVYLDEMPIGCIACAGGWQAAGQTLSALRTVAHSLRGWPTPFGAMLNTSNSLFDADGNCTDVSVKRQLETVAQQVIGFIRMQSGADAVTQLAPVDAVAG
ncbi:NAD(P)H-dependent oxidoreductase [Bradyrhizobium sp. KB893862 SZCCT0404]|uniref:NADPH-dependent FMN reductase n=1 Tax=Bradyrhizobium sp. KB893862 SZCCT0404 TaxID=2807672 RepID=UPI001BA619BA|nr:NAD(P)H-dependent oxidoreductase [Bradyrhizobium sp. KB893862 SZCCT0404]MBR1175282.1 NAD(P)H-dependent oxidoreductase [Bradyrhizobium sp. KB893862 SZCCT0404]